MATLLSFIYLNIARKMLFITQLQKYFGGNKSGGSRVLLAHLQFQIFIVCSLIKDMCSKQQNYSSDYSEMSIIHCIKTRYMMCSLQYKCVPKILGFESSFKYFNFYVYICVLKSNYMYYIVGIVQNRYDKWFYQLIFFEEKKISYCDHQIVVVVVAQ